MDRRKTILLSLKDDQRRIEEINKEIVKTNNLRDKEMDILLTKVNNSV